MKYLLCLELGDAGFDHTVLSEFRSRLLKHGAERRLFDAVLALAEARSVLTAGGRQRSDSTHVLGKIQILSRYGLVAETLRHAFDALAVAAPGWLRSHITPAWVDRYRVRSCEFRPPKVLLGAGSGSQRQVPMAWHCLRRLWTQAHLGNCDGCRRSRRCARCGCKTSWSSGREISPGWSGERRTTFRWRATTSRHRTTPRRATSKRQGKTEWTGYKVHLTKTCDADTLNLITNVETTAATVTDDTVTPVIHAALKQRTLLPSIHVADTAFVNSTLLVESRERYQVGLVGLVEWDVESISCLERHHRKTKLGLQALASCMLASSIGSIRIDQVRACVCGHLSRVCVASC